MVPVDAMSNDGRFGIRHNGAFELRWLNWVLTLGNATGTRRSDRAGANAEWRVGRCRAARRPMPPPALKRWARACRVRESAAVRPGTTPLKFAPEYEAWLVEAMRHGDNDAFWEERGRASSTTSREYKDVPFYHVTGWYDSWARRSPTELRGAVEGQEEPAAADVGPWTHGSQGPNFSGEVEFTADGRHRPERASACAGTTAG